jgi:hypothetical protein
MKSLPEQLRRRALAISRNHAGVDPDFIFDCLSIGAELAADTMTETIRQHRQEMDRDRTRANLPH